MESPTRFFASSRERPYSRRRRRRRTTTARHRDAMTTFASHSVVVRDATRAFSRAHRTARSVCASMASSTPPSSSDVVVVSWNVNGARALLAKNPRALDDLASSTNADVIVLQELKLGARGEREIERVGFLPEYRARAYATSDARLGYAGVAAFARASASNSLACDATCVAPSIEVLKNFGEFASEGRIVKCELERAVVVALYAPNSGEALKRLDGRVLIWERALREYVNDLRRASSKPVIVCGDLNVAHEENDVWGNHAANAKRAGYTPRERRAMDDLLRECDLIDTFRVVKGNDAREFSYWSYRARAREMDKGWRLDYVLAPRALERAVVDAFICPHVLGSDHAPVGARFRFDS